MRYISGTNLKMTEMDIQVISGGKVVWSVIIIITESSTLLNYLCHRLRCHPFLKYLL